MAQANKKQSTKESTKANANNAAGKSSESLPLNKVNYIMIAVSLVLIALGFFLMGGSANVGSTFNYDVFDSTRIVVAPFITFVGFLLMVPAILYRGKNREDIKG